MNELLGARSATHGLATAGSILNLGDDLTAALGAIAFNEYTVVLGVLGWIKKPGVRFIAGAAPGVLADGFLILRWPREEVLLNSHLAPNA